MPLGSSFRERCATEEALQIIDRAFDERRSYSGANSLENCPAFSFHCGMGTDTALGID